MFIFPYQAFWKLRKLVGVKASLVLSFSLFSLIVGNSILCMQYCDHLFLIWMRYFSANFIVSYFWLLSFYNEFIIWFLQEFHLSQTYHEGLLKLEAKDYKKARELLEVVLKDPLVANSQVLADSYPGITVFSATSFLTNGLFLCFDYRWIVILVMVIFCSSGVFEA